MEEFKPVPEGAIFVFGSNLDGRHGGGAAAMAHRDYDAKWGVGVGMTGQSYALPTLDGSFNQLELTDIGSYVDIFKQFAKNHPDKTFYVTKIGCGIAGFKEDEIRPMFKGSPANCILPYGWE